MRSKHGKIKFVGRIFKYNFLNLMIVNMGTLFTLFKWFVMENNDPLKKF
jgi:hypothetical protein